VLSDPQGDVQTSEPSAMPAIETSDGDLILAVNLDTNAAYFPAEPIGVLLLRMNALLDQYRSTLQQMRALIDQALKEE
jgi:hypothetical protein